MNAHDTIAFQKLHGSGNDFIVVGDARVPDDIDWVRHVCDRHRGVGADGVLVVSELDAESSTARMTIYNQDGTRPEMCGNGVRCVARWLVESQGFSRELTIESDAGPRKCTVEGGEPWRVEVDMGEPAISKVRRVEAASRVLEGIDVDMGNPHFVVFVDAMPSFGEIDEMGAFLNEENSDFAEGVNLELVELGKEEARVIVFERGVGRTQACGTGACAVAAAAWESGRHGDGRVLRVRLPGGVLSIERRHQTIWMTGDAEFVFAGEIQPEWMAVRGF